jgi:NCS1 family nucleobase:cation symporter-1
MRDRLVPRARTRLVALDEHLQRLVAPFGGKNPQVRLTARHHGQVGLRQVPALAKSRWNILMLFALVPVAFVSLVVPDLFFSNFGTFLAFIGVFFAPICAIQIVDYLILRRQRINIRAVFVGGPGTDYHYWGGFNPAAVLTMLAGFFTYLYLLNPVSYASNTPYDYLTASLPTALVAGVVYALITVLVVKPAGKGGY